MKTIAYSEVPQTHSYVHLAYLSASSSSAQTALPAAFLVTVAYLLVYLAGHSAKLNVKHPKAWRLMTLTLVTVTGLLAWFVLASARLSAGH
jgi:hypothetical protein